MRRLLIPLIALLCCATPAHAQPEFTPELMRWTSHVGRVLYGYHGAREIAAAAIRERASGAEVPPLYAGGPYEDGWAFSFGALEGDSAFVIRYGVIVSGGGTVTQFDAFTRRRVASPFHTAAARALATVREDFERNRAARRFDAEEYRFAVLALSDAGLTAFVSPAQTRPGVSLAGSDQMYEIGKDGRIANTFRLHVHLLPISLAPPPRARVAVLTLLDAPAVAPTDVLLAMERRAPLLVVVKRAAYLVEPDGGITLVPEDDPWVRAAREQSGGQGPASSSPETKRR